MKSSAKNVNMLGSYECEERKLHCFAIKVKNNHWNGSKQTSDLPVTCNSQLFFIYLAIRTKKRKEIFLLNSFALLERFQNALQAHIQQSNTAMEQSHSCRSAQAACANFSKCLTKNWSFKAGNCSGYHRGYWKSFLSLQHGDMGSRPMAGHVLNSCQASLIKQNVQLRDKLKFPPALWCLWFHKKQT